MGNLHHLSNSAIPLARQDIEAMLESVVAMQTVTGEMALILTAALDRVDGDPDEETNAVEDDFTPMPPAIDFGPGCEISDPSEATGDEEDGNLSEDDFCTHRPGMWGGGPGCPIADPGGCEHDGREPPQYVD